jgi:ATP-dependent Clp protease ATP-binding subunit ClpX
VQARTTAPSAIVAELDRYVIGQDDAKRTLAVAVYAHFKRVALKRPDAPVMAKSNVLLIGPSGSGKTLACATLARILGVPFASADATTLAQSRYVNEEIEAILSRLADKAGGDLEAAGRGIVFIDEVDKLKADEGGERRVSGESVQHALLKIMEGSLVKLGDGRWLDTTDVLFVCSGAFVGLDAIMTRADNYGFISTSADDNQRILERLNARVKPTDLMRFGLIPEFTGRLPVVARFEPLDKAMLVRVMTEPRDSLYAQFRELFRNEGVELVIAPSAFEQVADLAMGYKTGARSLRGLLEELVTPALYRVPDDPGIAKVVVTSIFREPVLLRGESRSA